MTNADNATAVRQDAQAVLNYVTGETVKYRLDGTEPPAWMTQAREAARNVLLRAGVIEAEEPPALTAAMETISPADFARRVRARRRMAALREKGAVK